MPKSVVKVKPHPEDAPDGRAWKCPDCDCWATLGCNAGYHRDTESHGDPALVPLRPLIAAKDEAEELAAEREAEKVLKMATDAIAHFTDRKTAEKIVLVLCRQQLLVKESPE